VDFYDAKADDEAVLASAGALGVFSYVPGEHPGLHPGQTAGIEREGRLVGYLGALQPELAKKLVLEQPVFLLELLLAVVVDG
ncbi:phenylalanine--tRNA ligase subunit beta, partial [Pseudomonas aeruginosa]